MQLILFRFKKINDIMIYLTLIFEGFKTVHTTRLYFTPQIDNQ